MARDDNYHFKDIRIITGTCDANAGTESTHAHGGARIPTFYIVLSTGNGVVYESQAADATNIYLKSSANSTTFRAFMFFRSQR